MLERRGTLSILNYLNGKENKKAYARELVEKLGIYQDTFNNSTAILIGLGLIERKEEGKFPFKVWYELTKNGETIGKMVSSIHDILSTD